MTACLAGLDGLGPLPSWPPSAALSLVLLRAARHEPLPADSAELLSRLEPATAAAALTRLQEHQVECTAVARAVDEAQRARAVLVQAANHLPLLLAAHEPVALPVGDAGLLFFPDAADRGVGALAPGSELVRAAGVELAGEPVFGQSSDPELLPVLGPVLGVRPRLPAEAPALGGPWLLTALLLVLALSFTGALWYSLRAGRHEAQALRSRAEFLTSVTHELKTPLASMRLFAEMLDGGRVASETDRQEYYRLLANEAVRLSALLDNVLDVGRMERGERAYDLRPIDLRALVQEVVELFAPLAAAAAMELAVVAPAAPLWVRGDRAALEQALLNVLDNARKYAGSGKRVVLTLAAHEGRAQVLVRDFGPGIPAAQCERIFARFVRGVPDGHPAPGVGLGLYLSRTILRGHGGDLGCAAPDDGRGGAQFCFTLPLVAAEVPA